MNEDNVIGTLVILFFLALFVGFGYIWGSLNGFNNGKAHGAELTCEYYVEQLVTEEATGKLLIDEDEEKAYCYVNFTEDGTKVRLENYVNDMLGREQ